MKLISVIIPTFQRVDEIENKLQPNLSILQLAARSTGVNFECIVVDDHSCDGTFDRLQQRFGKVNEMVVLRTPQNLGPGPTRDFGLSSAHGSWIWFLDDDDTLDAGQTTTLFSELLRTATNVDVISHSLKNTYTFSTEKARLEMELIQKARLADKERQTLDNFETWFQNWSL